MRRKDLSPKSTIALVSCLFCPTLLFAKLPAADLTSLQSKDSGNPWWLNNTPAIHYCLRLGSDPSLPRREQLAALIQKAFAYWKGEFSRAPYTESANSPPGNIHIATQEFIEQKSCDGAIDLKFQFGVLDKAQEQLMPGAKGLVSASVRESYDKQGLRGKGFIYLASAIGPHSPLKEADTWTRYDGNVLYGVLIHELGKVFGLPVKKELSYSAAYENPMAEDFLPSLLRTRELVPYASYFADKNVIESTLSVCIGPESENFQKFWGLPKARDYSFLIERSSEDTKVSYAADDGCRWEKPLVLLGHIKLEAPVLTQETVVQLYLPPEQEVYPELPRETVIPIVSRPYRTQKGLYQTRDKRTERTMSIRGEHMQGFMDGRTIHHPHSAW